VISRWICIKRCHKLLQIENGRNTAIQQYSCGKSTTTAINCIGRSK